MEGTTKPSDTTNDPGPTEYEMPDAEAVQERVKSGNERHSAEAAFGGQAEGEAPPESVTPQA